VACPPCHVLVVSALGTSGALSLFAPVQPVLGIVGVGVLGWALWRIVRAIGANREEPGSR
jgi:threonine/homoserine/homoserine lactone efflux protein